MLRTRILRPKANVVMESISSTDAGSEFKRCLVIRGEIDPGNDIWRLVEIEWPRRNPGGPILYYGQHLPTIPGGEQIEYSRLRFLKKIGLCIRQDYK